MASSVCCRRKLECPKETHTETNLYVYTHTVQKNPISHRDQNTVMFFCMVLDISHEAHQTFTHIQLITLHREPPSQTLSSPEVLRLQGHKINQTKCSFEYRGAPQRHIHCDWKSAGRSRLYTPSSIAAFPLGLTWLSRQSN